MGGVANALLFTGEGTGQIVSQRPKGRARATADTMSGEEGAQGPAPVYPGLGWRWEWGWCKKHF